MGAVPLSEPGNPSVAARTFEMISEHPFRYTSGDVIFAVHADAAGRIALVGVETADYAELASGRNPRSGAEPVRVTKAMRSS